MMLTHTRIPVALVAIGLVAACTNGKGDTYLDYWEPLADAGENQQVALGTTVTFDGSGSLSHAQFPDLAYSWALEQAPVDSQLDDLAFGTANGSTAAQVVNLLPDVVGTYVVSLTVQDGVSVSQPDMAVLEVTSENMIPVADCGEPQFGEVEERVFFDGTASRDPEGAQIEFSWTMASQPEDSDFGTGDIYDSQTATPSIVPDVAGTYVLSLIVSDGIDYSEPCYVSAMIASENQAPIADAGVSSILAPCAAEFELNGNGSFDPDGDDISYAWEVVSTPPGSAVTTEGNVSDPTIPAPLFSWDVVGEYSLSLQVFDGELYSARDLVTLSVQSPTANHIPTANAGSDQTIESTAECSTQDYVFDCADCNSLTFELDGTSSYDSDGDDLSYQWSDTNNEISYGGQYLAWTEAMTPPVPSTYETASDTSFDVLLTVADCEATATDSVILTVSCTGELP